MYPRMCVKNASMVTGVLIANKNVLQVVNWELVSKMAHATAGILSLAKPVMIV